MTLRSWGSRSGEAVGFLERHYGLKERGVLGGDGAESGEIVVLNRKLSWMGALMLW